MGQLLMGRGKSPRLIPSRKKKAEPQRPADRPGRHCVVCLKAKERGSYPICHECARR